MAVFDFNGIAEGIQAGIMRPGNERQAENKNILEVFIV